MMIVLVGSLSQACAGLSNTMAWMRISGHHQSQVRSSVVSTPGRKPSRLPLPFSPYFCRSPFPSPRLQAFPQAPCRAWAYLFSSCRAWAYLFTSESLRQRSSSSFPLPGLRVSPAFKLSSPPLTACSVASRACLPGLPPSLLVSPSLLLYSGSPGHGHGWPSISLFSSMPASLSFSPPPLALAALLCPSFLTGSLVPFPNRFPEAFKFKLLCDQVQVRWSTG